MYCSLENTGEYSLQKKKKKKEEQKYQEEVRCRKWTQLRSKGNLYEDEEFPGIAPYLGWRATRPDWSFSRFFLGMKREKCEVVEIAG